jgi:hypothetical protein
MNEKIKNSNILSFDTILISFKKIKNTRILSLPFKKKVLISGTFEPEL